MIGVAAVAGIRGVAVLGTGGRGDLRGKAMGRIAHLHVGMRTGHGVPVMGIVFRIDGCGGMVGIKLPVFLATLVAYRLLTASSVAPTVGMWRIGGLFFRFLFRIRGCDNGALRLLGCRIATLLGIFVARPKTQSKGKYERQANHPYENSFFHIYPPVGMYLDNKQCRKLAYKSIIARRYIFFNKIWNFLFFAQFTKIFFGK